MYHAWNVMYVFYVLDMFIGDILYVFVLCVCVDYVCA